MLSGLALGLLSVAGLGFLGTPGAEGFFIVTTVAVGVTALIHGAQRHHSMVPSLLFVAGMACIAIGHFAFAKDQNVARALATTTGGICLVLFHVVNRRMQLACGSKHCEHHKDRRN